MRLLVETVLIATKNQRWERGSQTTCGLAVLLPLRTDPKNVSVGMLRPPIAPARSNTRMRPSKQTSTCVGLTAAVVLGGMLFESANSEAARKPRPTGCGLHGPYPPWTGGAGDCEGLRSSGKLERSMDRQGWASP